MLKYYYAIILLILLITPRKILAAKPTDEEFNKILSLDITQLVVTSVSKSEEKATRAAAAIYVITHNDIRRMGATSLAEALRGVPGVSVGQIGSHDWAVGIRGFSNQFSNKLLVLIDGRSIYTPIFSGVFWDMDDLVFEDIDRIEVIRGPGATLWGANAVNGIINIITKNAANTQGTYLSTNVGSEEYFTAEGRYGGSPDKNTFYRVYAKEMQRGEMQARNGGDAFDDWNRLRSGFRFDQKGESNNYTVQGDIYSGEQGVENTTSRIMPPYVQTTIRREQIHGGNILTRWEHELENQSQTKLQLYLDNYFREGTLLGQEVTTADIDFQHVLYLNDRNEFIWGSEYRYSVDDLDEGVNTTFQDTQDNYSTLSAFAQNQYAVIPEKVFFTVGSKIEHNEFTGYEVQPSTRMSWMINDISMAWGAVSRAVRVPSRSDTDVDIRLQVVPSRVPGTSFNSIHVLGNNQLHSEGMIAYELGYRIYPEAIFSADLTTFYNRYDNILGLTQGTPSPTITQSGIRGINTPVYFTNVGYGHSYGAEAALNWDVIPAWQLKATSSYALLNLETSPQGFADPSIIENALPQYQFSLRSYINLPHNMEWNTMLYYEDNIATQYLNAPVYISANVRLDTQLGWRPLPGVSVSLTGRNLFNAGHTESTSSVISNLAIAEVGPSVVGNVALRF